MGFANATGLLGLPQWLGNEYLKREDMNSAFLNVETFARNLIMGNDLSAVALGYGLDYAATKQSDGWLEEVGGVNGFTFTKESKKTDSGYAVAMTATNGSTSWSRSAVLVQDESGNWSMEVRA